MADPTIAAAAASCIQADVGLLQSVLVNTYMRDYDRFWNTPAGNPDPQSVANALGNQGAALFQRSAALADFLAAQCPGAVPAAKLTVPPGYNVTVNADGTVTIWNI
jgi:hypothetical protein